MMFHRMYRHILLAACLLPPLAASTALAAASGRIEPARHPVVVQGAEQRTVFSADGREFRLFVSVPEAPVPATGFPVIYITDGNSIFGTLVDEIRRESADTYEVPAVVVAIGYPGNAPWDDPRRQHDLTPALPPGIEPIGPAGYAIPDIGGADVFLDLIEQVIQPAVARDYPVDPRRQTLAGHSLGGLFTLYALFTRPALFQTYVAMSPSIWYGQRHILGIETDTRTQRQSAGHPARLLLTIGGCEQTPGECDPGVPGSPQKDRWLVEDGRMVDDVLAMAKQVNASGTHVVATAKVFDDEHHESVIGGSIARLVRFALSPAEQPSGQ